MARNLEMMHDAHTVFQWQASGDYLLLANELFTEKMLFFVAYTGNTSCTRFKFKHVPKPSYFLMVLGTASRNIAIEHINLAVVYFPFMQQCDK